jgi:hypothetical protein
VRAARVGAGVRGAGAADGAGGLPPLQRRARVPLPVAPLLLVKMVEGLQAGASKNNLIIRSIHHEVIDRQSSIIAQMQRLLVHCLACPGPTRLEE